MTWKEAGDTQSLNSKWWYRVRTPYHSTTAALLWLSLYGGRKYLAKEWKDLGYLLPVIFWLLFYYTPGKRSLGVYRNHPVCLSVQSKLNLDHNFLTKGDRALILHKCIPCDKTFLSIPKFLTSWPWPWLLTYFWKNLTLAITFEAKEIGLSYFTSVFLVARPFCRYQNFWLRDLDFWPTFEKT